MTTIIVRNKRSGKTGTLVRKEGDRLLVAYGKVKVWGRDANYEYLPPELPFGQQESEKDVFCKICGNKDLAEKAERKMGESLENLVSEFSISTGITCPICKEEIREIRNRAVCDCVLPTFPPEVITIFADDIRTEFISAVRDPDSILEAIGDRYRWMCESGYGEYLNWQEINTAVRERFGEYHMNLIHDFCAADDMPFFDADELAIRRIHITEPEPLLRTFPKIELAGVYRLTAAGVSWGCKEKNLWKYEKGELLRIDTPPISRKSKHGLSSAISI